LISLADDLDKKGLKKEADLIDGIIEDEAIQNPQLNDYYNKISFKKG